MEEAVAPRVLVVDDEPDTARSIRKLLEKRFGASVEVVDCAEAVREKLADGFDLITLDYQMPDCDGISLLKEIAATPASPPVVMVTGHGDEQIAADAFRFGASGYVVKDQRMPELLSDAVNKALLENRLTETERALQAREKEFQTLVETANSIILKLDLDGNITYMNRYGLEFFGYSEDELIGRNVVGRIVEEVDSNGRNLDAMIQTILADPDAYRSNENENIKKNGERVWVAWSNHALYDDEGNMIGNLGVGNDITARKAAEASLVDQVANLRRLSSMVDGVSDAIFTLDKDLRINFWNKGAEQLYGFEPSEAIGHDPVEILHTEYPPGYDRQYALRKMEEKSHFRIEVTQFRKDGSRLSVDTTSWQFKDQDGNLEGVTCINRDVTAEREFEERLVNILDRLPDAVLVLDSAGKILYANDAIQTLLGREVPADRNLDSLRGDFYRMFRAGTDISYPPEETPIQRALKGEELTIDDVEIETGGRRIPLEVTAAPILGPDGEAEYAVGMMKDISERKRAEEELKKFQYVVDSSGEGFLITGLDRVVTYTNAALDELLGYESGELIGKRACDILLSDGTKARVLPEADAAYSEGGSWSGEFELMRKNGTMVPVLVASSAILDDRGQNIGIAAFVRDMTEYVRAQEQLKYQARILENIDEAIIGIDRDLIVTSWNKGAERIYGFTEKEAIGRYSPELLARDYPDGLSVSKMVQVVCEEGYLRQGKVHHRKDGTPVLVDGQSWPIKDSSGDIIGFVSLNRDISEITAAEDELRRQRAILDQIDDAIIVTDGTPENRITFFSEGAEKLYGWKAEEVVGKPGLEALPTRFVGNTRAEDLHGLLEKGGFRGEIIRRRRDGTPLNIETHATTQYDEDGQVVSVVSVNRDITEQKKLNEDYRMLLETVGSIIIRTDKEGNMLFMNDYGLQFFGYSEDELLGKNVVGTIVPEIESTGRDLAGLISSIMADPDSYHPNINENVKRNGERVWVSWSNKAIRDINGDVIGTLTVGNDVTDLKRGQEALASLNAELDGYAHMVSHDLKSPLAAIGIANAMLREDLADIKTERVRADIEETVDTVGRSLSRAYVLINGLLTLAEAGHVPTEVQPVDVAGTVREILSERAGDLSERGVDVSVDEDLGIVTAHPLHVYQVFSNIIGNAIRHNTSSEPAIGVHYRGLDREGAHLYEVCDNGSGVPEADLEGIFRPFFKRGQSSDTGIGLSIAKKIIEVYGGSIRVYNKNGACFEFTLKDWEHEKTG